MSRRGDKADQLADQFISQVLEAVESERNLSVDLEVDTWEELAELMAAAMRRNGVAQ